MEAEPFTATSVSIAILAFEVGGRQRRTVFRSDAARLGREVVLDCDKGRIGGGGQARIQDPQTGGRGQGRKFPIFRRIWLPAEMGMIPALWSSITRDPPSKKVVRGRVDQKLAVRF